MVRSSTNNSPHIAIKVHNVPPSPSAFNNTPPPPLTHYPPPPPPPPLPEEWFPWLVPVIFIVNVVVFLVSMYINNCPAHSRTCIGVPTLQRFAFENVRENPLLGPSTATLVKMGALDVNKVIQGGQQWRIVTCMWLHAGVFHIFANMLSLLGVGIRLEQEFGFGALFGLLGSMLSELFTNWTIYTNKLAALTTLILMILINLMVGILPHVDNFSHIGGFVIGFFLGFILLIRPQFAWINQPIGPPACYGQPTKPKYKLYQYILLVLSVIALIITFTIGFVFLFRKVDGYEYCSWCHYLSCVPTPLWSCDPKCNSTQSGNQLNLRCLNNGKSKSYMLPDGNDMVLIQELCSRLCT